MARSLFRYLVMPKHSPQPWTPLTLRQHLERLTGVPVEVTPLDTGFEVKVQAEPDVARLFVQLVKPHLPIQPLR